MTIALELSPEQEARLAAQAQAARIDNPADYIRALIDAGAEPAPITQAAELEPEVGPMPRTGAELLEYRDRNNVTGQFFIDGPDTPELARQLRRQAETRAWSTQDTHPGDGQADGNSSAA